MKNFYCSLLFLAALGCASQTEESPAPSWAGKMQGTAQSFQDLIPYLYNEAKFADKKNSKDIEKKIVKFGKSIHKIDDKEAKNILGDDPYVTQSLTSLQELTTRAYQSFKRGDRRNSRVLLKATTNTCFKCHTRQNVGPKTAYWKNFDVDEVETNPVEKAHILVAMRQYDRAKKQLKGFLSESEDNDKFDIPYENALHYYLMITLRGQNTFKDAMTFLNSQILVAKTPTPLHFTLKHWRKDLTYWSKNRDKIKLTLSSAKNILKRNKKRYSERNLVNNLIASSVAHDILMGEPTALQKSESYNLLGNIYDELIVEGFWDLPEVYYEMCINTSPKTKVAQKCFQNLKNNITLGYSGSRGTMVPSQEYDRLERLRAKAGL